MSSVAFSAINISKAPKSNAAFRWAVSVMEFNRTAWKLEYLSLKYDNPRLIDSQGFSDEQLEWDEEYFYPKHETTAASIAEDKILSDLEVLAKRMVSGLFIDDKDEQEQNKVQARTLDNSSIWFLTSDTVNCSWMHAGSVMSVSADSVRIVPGAVGDWPGRKFQPAFQLPYPYYTSFENNRRHRIPILDTPEKRQLGFDVRYHYDNQFYQEIAEYREAL